MANCNFKQGIGLVKEVTEQRSEEVRELSWWTCGGGYSMQKVQRLGLFVLNCTDVGGQSAGTAIFWGIILPFWVLEKGDK